MATEHEEILWLHASRRVSLGELSEACGLPREVLEELVEYGALQPVAPAPEERFGADCVSRLRAAARLRNDLELETPALALALAFLERIQALEAEVRSLDARLGRLHR